MSFFAEGFFDPVLPEQVRGKGLEIPRLELTDDVDRELGLLGESLRFTTIVASMPQLFTHKSVRVMSIVRGFSNLFIFFNVSSPWQGGPTYSSDSRMGITGFTDIEIPPVVE